MTGCRRPEHAILPHGRSPEELIPGVPAFYSSARPTSSGFISLIVESHEGRPTKIEGNPSYALSGGSTDIYTQASVLDLYDPDRARGCFINETESKGSDTSSRWKKLPSAKITENLSQLENLERVAILVELVPSFPENLCLPNYKLRKQKFILTRRLISPVPKKASPNCSV